MSKWDIGIGIGWFRIFFAWYDLWVGAYWDKDKQRLYICLVPMLVFLFDFGSRGVRADKFLKRLEPIDDDIVHEALSIFEPDDEE